MRLKVFIYLLILSISGFSQNQKVDSMLALLPTVEDTSKVRLLINISTLYWNKNNTQSLVYAKKALELSTEIQFKSGIAGSLSSIGVVSMYDNNTKAGMYNMLKAIEILEELKDSVAINRVKINLGAVYYNDDQFEKSIEIYKSVLKSTDKYVNDFGKSILYNNISLCYIEINQYEKALEMLEKSLVIKNKMNDKRGTATCYSNMGIVYSDIDSLLLAEKYYMKALIIHNEVDNVFGVAHCNLDLAILYLKENRLELAKNQILDAITIIEDNGYMFLLSEAYLTLSEINEAENNFIDALNNYKKSVHFKDSILNKKSHDELIVLQNNYAIKEELQKEQDVELEKNKQLFIRNLIIAILIFVSILSIVLYNRYKLRKRSERKLKALNYEKDKFFSIISHDLRGPFNAFLSLSEVLANSYEDLTVSEIKSYSKKINESAIRINYLLENLLEWAVSQTKRREYVFTKIDLKKIVNRSIELLNYNADRKNISITNNISDSIIVKGDSNSIKTVFRNILNNAIKFTENGGDISINVDDVNDYYKVSISDTGIGISEENLKKLFRIDVQYTTPGTDKEKGTGLGLILVKEFVEKNEGTITVESTKNKGTTFYFTLKKYKNG